MKRRIVILGALPVVAFACLPNPAIADACWDHWRAKLNGITAEGNRLIAQLKKTGDCSLIPRIQASSNRFQKVLFAVPCKNMVRHGKTESDAHFQARLRKFCKGGSQKSQTAANSKGASDKPKAAPKPNDSGNPGAQTGASCSDITGTSSGTAAKCPAKQTGKPNAQIATTAPTAPSSSSTPPPSKGAAAIESLRSLLPELGTLIDEVNQEVNSPNIPPPTEWQAHNEGSPTENKRDPRPAANTESPAPDSSANQTAASSGADTSSSDQDTGDDDDDYAEICRSEAVKDGLKSLQQDLEEATKNENDKYRVSFFLKKLRLQWATLKKCVRDPLQKAVIEKLEQDPIILDAE